MAEPVGLLAGSPVPGRLVYVTVAVLVSVWAGCTPTPTVAWYTTVTACPAARLANVRSTPLAVEALAVGTAPVTWTPGDPSSVGLFTVTSAGSTSVRCTA